MAIAARVNSSMSWIVKKTLKIPILLYYNNQFALGLMDMTCFHFHTKHIFIHYHFICQLAVQQKILFQYYPTYIMHGYLLTKFLSRPKLA
uniref:Reverse transcriptase Ty1/copia-type domain-containing protein n=1 Tax=Physcomitrium patens TaxID=3218 RepID=A0A2K1IVF3_PHYPA|nr:hypothetical protein PHYPA_025197 [Physcomitrium patens]